MWYLIDLSLDIHLLMVYSYYWRFDRIADKVWLGKKAPELMQRRRGMFALENIPVKPRAMYILPVCIASVLHRSSVLLIGFHDSAFLHLSIAKLSSRQTVNSSLSVFKGTMQI